MWRRIFFDEINPVATTNNVAKINSDDVAVFVCTLRTMKENKAAAINIATKPFTKYLFIHNR